MDKKYINQAKKVDLRKFVSQCYPDRIVFNGGSYRDSKYDSLVFYSNHFYRFSTGEFGDQIDYMRKYLDKSFTESVMELCNFVPVGEEIVVKDGTVKTKTKKFYRPVECRESDDDIIKYLQGRGISKETINVLFKDGLLYSARIKGDGDKFCCFAGENFYILRNTEEHGIQKAIFNKDDGGFWVWEHNDKVEYTDLFQYLKAKSESKKDYSGRRIFVCEAPIDAISIYEIIKDDSAVYCAMGGLKHIALQQIVNQYGTGIIVLAVDNDKKGTEFIKKHSEYQSFRSRGKDWNEDLMQFRGLTES